MNSSLNESNVDLTGSTIGLLLGVTAKDVKAEHRAALLTFQQWNLMDIEEDVNNTINDDGHMNLSFSERLFQATVNILRRDEEKRIEQHYRIPSTIHTSIPSSPILNLPQSISAFALTSNTDNIKRSETPTFSIISSKCDTPSINALQRSLIILMTQYVFSAKDNIECYFECVEKAINVKGTNDQSIREDSNDSNCILGNSTSILKTDIEENVHPDLSTLEIQEKQSEDETEILLGDNTIRHNPSLPPKKNATCRKTIHTEPKEVEAKKNLIKLDFSCPSSNIIEIDINKKAFARLTKFISSSKHEYCDRYVMLQIRINGKFCKPTNNKDNETYGQLMRIETPLSTLEHLIEESSIIDDSTLNWVNGMDKAALFGIDQNLAHLVSKSTPIDIFSWMTNYETSAPSKELIKHGDKFPTLIHWAAYHGMDKLIISLLNLPGSNTAAQLLNRDKKSASEMAKCRGFHHISALIDSKITPKSSRCRSNVFNKQQSSKSPSSEQIHEYEYPNVTFSTTSKGTIDQTGSDLNSAMPPQSNISPPPTPPSVSKLYDLKIEYEKLNSKSLRTSSSLSGESWTPSTNRSSTVSSGLMDIVNNDLYDIPRSCNAINSSKKLSDSTEDYFEFETPSISEQRAPESNKEEYIKHVEYINAPKSETVSKSETEAPDKKPQEYSYIPMQPRCNSTGQSSYSSSSTDNQYNRSLSSQDYNSMDRKKKSNSASCIVSSSRKNSLMANETPSQKEVIKANCLEIDTSEPTVIQEKNALVLRSSPKPRHEFMKTYINFSNQEALLSDDYSPYAEKCDVKSLKEDSTLSKASSMHENLEKGSFNTSYSEEKPASNLGMGFTPTFISKFKKPIQKADSLTLPPKTPKKKNFKKVTLS